MKFFYSKDFLLARIIIYFVTIAFLATISFIYENTHFDTNPCALCGMTRAISAIFQLDFAHAFSLNHFIGWVIGGAIFIILDIVGIIFFLLYKHSIVSISQGK